MVRQLEGLRTAFAQDPDAVDQRVVAGEEGRQQPLVADRNVQRRDLSNIAHRLEELRLLGIAAADGDDLAAGGEPLDDVAADKAGPAEHRGSAISHGLPRWARPAGALISRTLYLRGRPTTQGTERCQGSAFFRTNSLSRT